MYTEHIMNKTFSKAPLVEIVVELKWSPQPDMIQMQKPIGVSVPLMSMNSSKLDEFFMRFGEEIYQQGFQRAERVVPSGSPMMLFQPVYRYRKNKKTDGSVLYQTGPGLFSANATPPYRSWDEFAPLVLSGIDALLKARDETERNIPFTSVSLRYIDAFGPNLTEGRDINAFISDVLGISINLPTGLSKLVLPGQKAKPLLQLSLPLTNNRNMYIGLGMGMVNNETTIVMDTTVATSGEVLADTNTAMETLHAAREVIHELFLELTEPIQHLMQPVDKG
jgi:uncharacterized protein (TIGR04255 family)